MILSSTDSRYQMVWHKLMARKRPAFLLGIASLVDFFGILSAVPKMKANGGGYKPLYDDTEAIADDWRSTGEDIWAAMKKFSQAEK